MATASFFHQAPVSITKNLEEGCFIEVGGYQFQALAIAFIDELKMSAREQETLVKVLLERLFSCFPQIKPSLSYLKPIERMQILLNSNKKSELIACMAYTLRQLCIDRLWSEPLSFSQVFENLDSHMSQLELRNSRHNLPLNALQALACALDVGIVLSQVAPNCELPRRLLYQAPNSQPKFCVYLKVDGANYQPRVRHQADFSHISTIMRKLEPVHSEFFSDSIVSIMTLIAANNARISQRYLQSYKQLMSMVSAGELDKQGLINLYIHFLPAQIDNNQSLCSSLQNSDLKTDKGKSINMDEDMVKQLASSLAIWLCSQLVNENDFYKVIDERPSLVGKVL